MLPKIEIRIDSNERSSDRTNGLILAATKDPRFTEPCFSELTADVQFGISEKIYNVELKDFSDDGKGSDYVNSIQSGHLWMQCLAAREAGLPYAICILGDDHDIQGAIRKAAEFRPNGNMDGFDFHKFAQYSAMVDGFEANCIGLNIPIWHLGYNQFPRLLLRVRKILEGGDLSGFAPHPAENEREIVGLSILVGSGVGPKKAKAILEKFDLKLIAKEDSNEEQLLSCPGIGPKLAAMIRKKIEVVE